MTGYIETKDDDGVWTVTLKRADKANALTADMLDALADIAQAAQSAKALILTGVGKVFSAGADLDQLDVLATYPAWERLSANIAQINGLTIAALNGTVAGGAMGMALACDLRLAVPDAKAFYPVMRVGVLPQPSDPGRMSALIGPARTKMILVAAQKITADTAANWGLFDEVVPADQLMDRAYALADGMRHANPSHVTMIKNAV